MSSLKNLVMTQGMTVVSVIHQPPKAVFDMFTSLFLLGIGGQTVYAGPAAEAHGYFENFAYELKAGDSLADWFLDISSGDIEPTNIEAGLMNGADIANTNRKNVFGTKIEVTLRCEHIGFTLEQPEGVEHGHFEVKEVGVKCRHENIQVGDELIGVNGHGTAQLSLKEVNALLDADSSHEYDTVFIEILRQQGEELTKEDVENHLENESSLLLCAGKEDEALVKAKVAREYVV